MEIEIGKNRACIGCGDEGKWRFVTRHYICHSCRERPRWQLITRTRVMDEYKLEYKQLKEAEERGELELFTCRNPYNHKFSHCKLYYVGQVEEMLRREWRRKENLTVTTNGHGRSE